MPVKDNPLMYLPLGQTELESILASLPASFKFGDDSDFKFENDDKLNAFKETLKYWHRVMSRVVHPDVHLGRRAHLEGVILDAIKVLEETLKRTLDEVPIYGDNALHSSIVKDFNDGMAVYLDEVAEIAAEQSRKRYAGKLFGLYNSAYQTIQGATKEQIEGWINEINGRNPYTELLRGALNQIEILRKDKTSLEARLKAVSDSAIGGLDVSADYAAKIAEWKEEKQKLEDRIKVAERVAEDYKALSQKAANDYEERLKAVRTEADGYKAERDEYIAQNNELESKVKGLEERGKVAGIPTPTVATGAVTVGTSTISSKYGGMSPDTISKEAVNLLLGGKAPDAIPLFQKLINLNPDSVEPYVNLGAIHRDLWHQTRNPTQRDKAIEYLEQAQALSASNPSSLQYRFILSNLETLKK